MHRLEAMRYQDNNYLRISSVLHCFKFPDDAETSDLARRDEAARIGKQVHARIEKYAKGLRFQEPKSFEAKTAWANWLEWMEYTGWKVDYRTQLETRKYSKELGVTGCPDVVSKAGVIDWKTSQRLLTRHWIQANAYVGLTWPEQDRDKKLVQLVRLDKNQRTWEDKVQSFDAGLWEWFKTLVLQVQRVYGVEHWDIEEIK